MNLQQNPNFWSCLPASFATVLDASINHVLRCVGHDGSEILRPEMPDPERRRGFHIQEMIEVAIFYGYAVTPIEARPMMRLFGHQEATELPLDEGAVRRLTRLMGAHIGVLTGLNPQGRPHAVVWNGYQLFDTTTMGSYELRNFSIDTFWWITRAEHSPK